MILNEWNRFVMDRPMVNLSPDSPDACNIDNIGVNHDNTDIYITGDPFYNPHNGNYNNFNRISCNGNNGNNMEDGFIFDDKPIDFDNDLDTLSLSLWQSEGFNGINCEEPMKIEDIFQTDIVDFTGGPTLAELNLVDDKLDATDLDEYLANPPSLDNMRENGSSDDDKSPVSLTSTDLKKLNTLNGLGVFNNVNIPSGVTPVQLSPDDVDQIVNLTESPNNNPQDFDASCVNSQSQSSYSPVCPSWDTKKALQSAELLLNQPSLSPCPSHLLHRSPQSVIEPYVDHKLAIPSTSVDKPSTSDIDNQLISSPADIIIKQEPVSPSMGLSNLVISHDNENCDVSDDKVAEEERKVDLNVYQAGPSPEYVKPRLRRRNNSNSTECSFSSHDEGFASQPEDNSDNDQENDDSDDESFYKDYDAKDLIGATTSGDSENKWALDMGRSRKTGQQRFFWQYNVQSKGPKGTRIVSLQEICNDPHVLMEAKDPVFSSECSMEGVKHAGKARRGDGNDLTPNPKKLLMIGLELKKLSKVINELTPVAQVPVNSRNKSRKEKNKLASRACRLKKKAQHEANKIKLYGLQQEHKRMMNALTDIQHLANVVLGDKRSVREGRLTDLFETIVSNKGPKVKVAGNTTEFVNSILDNISAGISDGGLDQL